MANQNGKIAPFGSLCDAVTNRHPQGGESAPFDADAMKSGNVLGKKIAEARKQKKISQKDLSQLFSGYKINVSSGAISKWEKGDALPNPYQLLSFYQLHGHLDALNYFSVKTAESCDYSP